MFAGLGTLQPPNQHAPFLPLDIGPTQIAEFGNTQTVVEAYPYGGCVACAVAILPCRLAQRQDFIAAQMLARTAFLIGDPTDPA